jgi:hypothetical protein
MVHLVHALGVPQSLVTSKMSIFWDGKKLPVVRDDPYYEHYQ